jgi:hypothetical protein
MSKTFTVNKTCTQCDSDRLLATVVWKAVHERSEESLRRPFTEANPLLTPALCHCDRLLGVLCMSALCEATPTLGASVSDLHTSRRK